jgi:hypothetical protein
MQYALCNVSAKCSFRTMVFGRENDLVHFYFRNNHFFSNNCQCVCCSLSLSLSLSVTPTKILADLVPELRWRIPRISDGRRLRSSDFPRCQDHPKSNRCIPHKGHDYGGYSQLFIFQTRDDLERSSAGSISEICQ